MDPATPPNDVSIEGDLVCCSCGYNLRGLTDTERCPECAMSIAESAQRARSLGPSPLNLCDPRWLQTLSWGCALILAAAISTPLLRSVPNDALAASSRLVGAIRLGVPEVMIAAGIWMLSSREKRPGASRAEHVVCILLRDCVVGLLISAIVLFCWEKMSVGEFWVMTARPILSALVTALVFSRLSWFMLLAGALRLRLACWAMEFLMPTVLILPVIVESYVSPSQMFGSTTPIYGDVLERLNRRAEFNPDPSWRIFSFVVFAPTLASIATMWCVQRVLMRSAEESFQRIESNSTK